MTTPDTAAPTPATMPAHRAPAAEPTPSVDGDSNGLDETGHSVDPKVHAEIRKNRSENKGLRERLRATEGDLETASTMLTAMRRAEAQRVAAEFLVDGTDLWTEHPDVDDFLADDGTIDPAKVAQAAQAITSAKPHLAAPKKAPPPTDRPVENLRPGASTGDKPPPTTWAGALRPRIGT